MNKKKIISILIPVLLVASLAGNIYWLGKQWLDKQMTAAFRAGSDATINAITEAINKTGMVLLTTKDGQQIKLILQK